MIKTEKAHDVLSVSDFRERVASLSEAEWIKLGTSADYLCLGLAIEGEDLLHTALCKAFEGKRRCPEDLPAIVFIYGIMKSLVYAYLKKRRHDPLAQSIDIVVEDDLLEALDLKPNIDTPEEILIANQMLNKINKTFSGNETIEMVLMAQLDGYSPKEIQNLVGLSPVQYASTLTAINRKIKKLDQEESTT